MKKILLILITVVLIGQMSCTESYFDINRSPDNPQSVTPDLRLPPIIAYSMEAYMWGGFRSSLLTQQWAYIHSGSTARYYQMQLGQFQFSSTAWPWQKQFVYASINIPALIFEAEREGANHYIGVALVMKAFSFAYLTDLYGDIPYTEALQGDIYEPKFDSQKDIYAGLQEELDKAIEYLGKEQSTDAHSLAMGDIMFKGDTQKWIKLAYGLKARLYLHLNKKSTYDPDLVLTNLAKSMTSNADDADLVLGGDFNDSRSIFSPLRGNIGRMRITNLALSYLNNDFTGGSGVVDPRIDTLLHADGDGNYAGVETGDHEYGDALTLYDTYYGRTESSIPFLSYSEVKFMEAEAKFRNDKAGALTAYKAAIEANMQKLGVAQLAIDAFLASAAVAQTADALTLSHIMMQKYIALGYNPEVWTDVRRHDYSDNGVYIDMELPANYYEPLKGKWLRRFSMAYYELSYNVNNVPERAGEEDYVTDPVWWDIAE